MKQTTHEEVQPLLAIYRDLDGERRRRMEAHLEECEACARELARFQAMDRQLGELRKQHRQDFRHRRPEPVALLAEIEAANRPAGRLYRWLAPLSAPARLAAGLVGVLVLVVAVGVFASWLAALRQGAQVDRVAVTGDIAGRPVASFVTAQENGAALGRVAYVQDGDLWMKELPDGEPQRLTEGGESHEPRWSPSGEWLAFRKGHFVWVMDVSAPEEAFSLETTAGGGRGGFVWSPVADRLAFTAGNRLQLLEAASGTIKTLVSLPEDGEEMHRITNPFWMPDGTAIAYEQYRIPAGAGEGFQGDHGIWLVEVADGEPTRLYDSQTPEKGAATLAGWSGDGRHLLFWQSPILSASAMMDGAPLYALPLAGGEPLRIGAETVEETDTQMLPLPDFLETAAGAPDMVLTVGSGRETWVNKRIAQAEPVAGIMWPFTPPEKAAITPARSPDRESVAYAAEASGSASRLQRHLEVVDLREYSEPRLLTDDPAYREERPRWSADGNYILFPRIDAEEQASLWLIPAAGGEAEQVVASLSPPPEATGWFATYGYVEWSQYYDWWQGPVDAKVGTGSCPTSPVDTGFWDYIGDTPVAGEFPVWFGGVRQEMGGGPAVVPPADEVLDLSFVRGLSTKMLLFVDQRVEGNLVLSGRQLDGDGQVYFPGEGDLQRLNESELVLRRVPPTELTITDAHISMRQPQPEELAHQGFGPLFIRPGCYELTATIGEHTVQVVMEVAQAKAQTLALNDYPPSDTPYFIEVGDFWLVHTPDGDLLAFAPVSPEYRDAITVDECRYTWNEAVGRFVDPCSGDEWELDGRLNLDHSTELWSETDLDRYALAVEDGTVTVHLDQVISGTARAR